MTVAHLLRQLRPVRDWILLYGNRLLVTGGLLVLVFSVFGGAVWLCLFRVTKDSPLFSLLSATIAGNILLISIAVSINQLVLSQELRSVNDAQTILESITDYRAEVETMTNQRPAPVMPAAFFDDLLAAMATQTHRLEDHSTATTNDQFKTIVEDLIPPLIAHIDYVRTHIGNPENKMFDTLAIVLDADYSPVFYQLRQLETGSTTALSESSTEAVENLQTLLFQLDVARQYFKGLYLQEEMPKSSRLLLYTGLPAVVAPMLLLGLITALIQIARTIPASFTELLLVFGFTIGLVPLSLLFAFTLRIATVSQRASGVSLFASSFTE